MPHREESGAPSGPAPLPGTASDAGPFGARIEHEGGFASQVQAVPAWLITVPTPTLLGADRAFT
jgi:glucokinase